MKRQDPLSILVHELTDKTQELKERFIKITKKAAKRMFNYKVKQTKWTEEEWYKAFDVKYIYKEYRTYNPQNPIQIRITPDSSEYHKKNLHKMRDTKVRVKDIVDRGYEHFEKEEVKYAEHHYESSVIKLAQRLIGKGINNGSQFKITNEWIGVNLHITIKHGDQITRAYTIIAEGPIKRAHYRYLIR